jgi:hypothetical protein
MAHSIFGGTVDLAATSPETAKATIAADARMAVREAATARLSLD